VASNYENRLRKLEKQSHRHDNPVLIVNLAENGTYCHSDGTPATQEELQRAQRVIIDDVSRIEQPLQQFCYELSPPERPK